MRIAQFHIDLPVADRKVGGVSVFVHRLGNRLADRGHDVTIFTFGDGPDDARYTVRSVGPPWMSGGLVTSLTVASLALNRLHLAEFDVLHLHGNDWFMCRRTIPTVRTFHGSALLEARSATSRKRRLAQSAVYPLELVASRLATRSYSTGTRLPAGYSMSGSLTLAVEAPSSPESVTKCAHPCVLFVGTWEGRKRGAVLARRFVDEVLPHLPDAKLIMVSDRCDELPGVVWVRFPSDEELSRLYRSAWLLCVPSTYEGFGMPYLEAMAHGLPVVSTPNPGALHVLSNGSGVITSDADLGQSIRALLEDDDARVRLATAGRTRAERFSWERVLAEHETAYAGAISAFARR